MRSGPRVDSNAGLTHKVYDLGYDGELGALLFDRALNFAGKRRSKVAELGDASFQIDLDLLLFVDDLHELGAHPHIERAFKEVLLLNFTLLA